MKRQSGVLMNISSLPSPYGIGVIGKQAEDFAKKIKKMGFSKWQILPLNPPGAGNSPYSSDGAFAGNILYIDPEKLAEDGLVTNEDVKACYYSGTPYRVNYEAVTEKKLELLKKAHENITDEYKAGTTAFLKNTENFNYAYFKALKEHFDGEPFYNWKKEYKVRALAEQHKGEFADEIFFHGFCMYVFMRQWKEFKKNVNELGIELIGDMPIYVNLDSADVWSHTDLFLLNKNTFRPQLVAGVPPDYFSEDGQLWGNPLFDWKAMEEDGFNWWIERIAHSLSLYDTLRIDHFRGFASFWAVGAKEETAKNGKWKKGPGMKLFDAVNKKLKNPSIIAEDLGEFGKDVENLLKDTGFAGMRVIQFGFDGKDNSHLPQNHPKNCIAYTGTHDNDTVLGWLYSIAEDETRKLVLDYCGFKDWNWGEGGFYSRSVRAVIETVWRSPAALAIVPVQDMCGFGSDTRINVPGTPDGNWEVRFTKEQLDSIDADYFKRINTVFVR